MIGMYFRLVAITCGFSLFSVTVAAQVVPLRRQSHAQLEPLNLSINRWFVLSLLGSDGVFRKYHLENPFPSQNTWSVNEKELLITDTKSGATKSCSLWNSQFKIRNQQDIDLFANPFFPECDAQVYFRLKRPSATILSATEKATAALRQYGFGEKIINFGKPFIVGLSAETAQSESGVRAAGGSTNGSVASGPSPAQNASKLLIPVGNHHLGFELQGDPSQLDYGLWYESKMHQGIYAGIYLPSLVPEEIVSTFPDRVDRLSEKEKKSLVYVTAYDLRRYAASYVAGVSQPLDAEPKGTSPIVNIGNVPPHKMDDSVGVFIGGFKGIHGKIKYGPLRGRSSGLIEGGVERSPMAGGLATLWEDSDGNVRLGAWPEGEEGRNQSLRTVSARQNGVLVVEGGEPTQFVNRWGFGNWSGDANGNLFTLRSAVCIQENEDRQYLLFFAFTGATPSTLARVMQAYRCQSGMQLDMNAYMYLHNAIFKLDEAGKLSVSYLHTEMEYPKGIKLHRYILDNNERDFFYVYRKNPMGGGEIATRGSSPTNQGNSPKARN